MAPPPAREPSRRTRAREALLEWFDTEGEAYPWRRGDRDPCAVLVSEVMLQQTQAARVAESYPAFLRRFPDVSSLAAASPGDVLRAWGSLGYHRRVVALHRAAREIARDHDGRVPSELVALRELPGVGPYTAAAVASIAFDAPVAAIDTNARKVFARLALGRDPHEVPASTIADAAGSWLARDRPGDWNQAVMDLGREICRPEPRCDRCPLEQVCRYRTSERVHGRVSPARRQPAFAGSMRQLRGLIVRELRGRKRAVTVMRLANAIDQPVVRAGGAVDALVRDGVVERTANGRVRLPR